MKDTKTKALVIEDDEAWSRRVCDTLSALGCTTDATASGRDALARILQNTYDLAVVDMELADGSGSEIVHEAKANALPTQSVPVSTTICVGRAFVLTGTLCGPNAALLGLYSGADDYLEKSLAWPEIRARLEARVRRIRSNGAPARLVWSGFTLDPEFLDLYERVDGKDVLRDDLSLAELRIMHCLMRAGGESVSSDFLARKALRYSSLPENYRKCVGQRIYDLRRKLGMTEKDKGIVNERGEGYALV